MKKGEMKATQGSSSLLVTAALPSEFGGSAPATTPVFLILPSQETTPSSLQEISCRLADYKDIYVFQEIEEDKKRAEQEGMAVTSRRPKQDGLTITISKAHNVSAASLSPQDSSHSSPASAK